MSHDLERCETWGHTRSMPDPTRCVTCGADISRNATEAYAAIGRSLADELIAREENNERPDRPCDPGCSRRAHPMAECDCSRSDEAQREYLYTTLRDRLLEEGIDADRAHRIAWRLLPLFTGETTHDTQEEDEDQGTESR